MNGRIAVILAFVAAVLAQGSTLTLVNNCATEIALCSTYGGPLFNLAAGANATNQPSGPYNECGSVQAESECLRMSRVST